MVGNCILVVYSIVVLVLFRKKVAAMRNNWFKRLVHSSNIIVAILIVYYLYTILERAMIGADIFFFYFTSFEVVGFVLYNTDSIINNHWIREQEYKRDGYDLARKEYYKDHYLQEFQHQDEVRSRTRTRTNIEREAID